MKLTAAQLKIVQDCTVGQPIFTERQMPFPHKYYYPAEEKGALVSVQTTEAAIQKLVEAGYLEGRPKDAVWDSIHYTLTPAGRLAVNAALAEKARPKNKKGKRSER